MGMDWSRNVPKDQERSGRVRTGHERRVMIVARLVRTVIRMIRIVARIVRIVTKIVRIYI